MEGTSLRQHQTNRNYSDSSETLEGSKKVLIQPMYKPELAPADYPFPWIGKLGR